MKKNIYSRRKFIIKSMGLSTAFIGGAGLLVGCDSQSNKNGVQNKASKVTPKSCDDLSGVNKSEIQKREKLSYVNKTPVPGSDCNNCQFHIPEKYGKGMGGCLLFDGPVCPTGYCTQYAKAES